MPGVENPRCDQGFRGVGERTLLPRSGRIPHPAVQPSRCLLSYAEPGNSVTGLIVGDNHDRPACEGTETRALWSENADTIVDTLEQVLGGDGEEMDWIGMVTE